MFGILKENVLNKLEKTYNDNGETVFKKEFNQYIKTIKENKDLKEFYEVYDLFNQVNFDDESIAKEFVDESINYLKQFNLDTVKLLESMLASEDKLNSLHEESIEYKLDQLVFNENLDLKDKAIFKVKLIKQITNRNTEKVNHQEAFNTLHDKINENVSKLNENQIELLNLFIENDSQKINDYYTNLIIDNILGNAIKYSHNNSNIYISLYMQNNSVFYILHIIQNIMLTKMSKIKNLRMVLEKLIHYKNHLHQTQYV